MASALCVIDDKVIPLYRILWISQLPHFCGHEDCEREGAYEIRLEQDESVWGSQEERDAVIAAIEQWQSGMERPDDWA